MLLAIVAGAILFFTCLVIAVGPAPYLRIAPHGHRRRHADDRRCRHVRLLTLAFGIPWRRLASLST